MAAITISGRPRNESFLRLEANKDKDFWSSQSQLGVLSQLVFFELHYGRDGVGKHDGVAQITNPRDVRKPLLHDDEFGRENLVEVRCHRRIDSEVQKQG